MKPFGEPEDFLQDLQDEADHKARVALFEVWKKEEMHKSDRAENIEDLLVDLRADWEEYFEMGGDR